MTTDRKKNSHRSELIAEKPERCRQGAWRIGICRLGYNESLGGCHGRNAATERTCPTDRRWPMELMLTESEVELLQGMLDADRKALLMEIARTDNRAMRDGLKEREELLKGILDRLGSMVRKAS